MQEHLVLKAKIRELEEAYREAASLGHTNEAKFWNNEVINYLLVLSDSFRNSKADSGSDSGEQPGS